MLNSKLVDAALVWARQGVPVFPCTPQKVPLTANGFHDAVTDEQAVRVLFGTAPDDAMIGGRLGSESGLFVVDFDLYKGDEVKKIFESLQTSGLLPDTQVHGTQSGGLHLLYRHEIQPNRVPYAGVEVKGEGGYVILPPSSGYSILSEGIATAPDALIQRIMSGGNKSSSSDTYDGYKSAVMNATDFHDALTKISSVLSARRVPAEEILAQLKKLLESSVASNPSHDRHERWSAIVSDKGQELSRIVRTGDEKFNGDRIANDAKHRLGNAETRKRVGDGGGFFDNDEFDGGVEQLDVERIVQDALDSPKDMSWPFETEGYASETDRNIFDQEYVVYPLLPEREVTLLAAEPKAGKTALALTWAQAVSKGRSLGENFVVTKPKPVLYFALESARAIELRLAAIRKYNKDNNISEPKEDKLFVVDAPQNFLQESQQDMMCTRIMLHNEKCKAEFGEDLGIIVIDTLTKAMPAGDQNSVEDTGNLFLLIGKLRQMGVTANIMFLHHLAKTGEVRGSTNIEAEVDLVLGVNKIKESTDIKVNIRRARSINEEVSYRWAFESVSLGKTKQGHELSAPVLVHKGRPLPTSEKSDSAVQSVLWNKFSSCILAVKHPNVGFAELYKAVIDTYGGRPLKRPSYTSKAAQSVVADAVSGHPNTWVFGENVISLTKDANGNITGANVKTVI